MSNQTIYEMVTNRIIEKLEEGIIPWRKPWKNGGAVNWVTQKSYRGVNVMLLEPGEYATFKQITSAGGKVKKGAKSHFVIFWKWLLKENEQGEEEKIPMLRYYRVFEINTQVEGLQSKRKSQEFDHTPLEQAELILKGYIDGPKTTFKPGGAFYQPDLDKVTMPPLKHFTNPEEYYSTFFHEMVHSTGHQSRLNRDGVTGIIRFGSEDYSKEELVAEMGAAMLCGVARIENSTLDNTTAYIQSWLRKLKDDKTLLVKAGSQAQRAVDHIQNIVWDAGE
jgi:antirestriction protein ArdC